MQPSVMASMSTVDYSIDLTVEERMHVMASISTVNYSIDRHAITQELIARWCRGSENRAENDSTETVPERSAPTLTPLDRYRRSIEVPRIVSHAAHGTTEDEVPSLDTMQIVSTNQASADGSDAVASASTEALITVSHAAHGTTEERVPGLDMMQIVPTDQASADESESIASSTAATRPVRVRVAHLYPTQGYESRQRRVFPPSSVTTVERRAPNYERPTVSSVARTTATAAKFKK